MKANGAWGPAEAQHHQSSQFLGDYFTLRFDLTKPVFDFGCGPAYYVRRLREAGFESYGYDGYVANDLVKEIDLSKPVDLGVSGTVISLEVGEHIPKEFQEVYTDTITRHCDGLLVMSWAEVGQPGIGHVNCRDQDEVIADIVGRGFRFLNNETAAVRKGIENNVDWFRRTLLIFEKCYGTT